MKKSGSRPNLAMCFAAVLFCLVLASTYMTSGLYAKYTSSTEMLDGARTAMYVFNVKDKTKHFTIPVEENQPGAKVEYGFVVTNGNGNGKVSEVAQEYTITLKLSGSLPLVCTMKEGEQTKVTIDALTDNQVGSAEKSFTEKMSASVEIKDSYDLVIEWPKNEVRMDPKYMGGVAEIEITINAAQID